MTRKFVATVALAALIVGGSTPLAQAHGRSTLQNPGFEADGTAVPRPSGWKTRGDRTASSVEAGGHSGELPPQLTGARLRSASRTARSWMGWRTAGTP